MSSCLVERTQSLGIIFNVFDEDIDLLSKTGNVNSFLPFVLVRQAGSFYIVVKGMNC